eukprot:jgi/Galph1/2041/GphlegSOOS_G706.1
MNRCNLATALGFYVNSIEGLSDAFSKSLDDIFHTGFHSVLLTNFMFDLPWLFERIPTLLTAERVLIVHGDDQPASVGIPTVALHKPRLPFPYGTHHTKLIILFYSHGVRFVLTTANMIASDWECKTQGIFLKDFSTIGGDNWKHSYFLETLDDYLSSLGKPLEYFRQLLQKYDFSSAGVVLVPSVPGYHRGKKLHSYGHMALRQCISKYVKTTCEVIPLTHSSHSSRGLLIQCSSIGSVSEKWFHEEFLCSLLSFQSKDVPYFWHLMWPNVDQVRTSIQGYYSGYALLWSQRNRKDFLESHLCPWNGSLLQRDRAMPHMKSYLAYEENGYIHWFLLTCANLSGAAWGCLQKKQSNSPQLFIRSYELGIFWTASLIVPLSFSIESNTFTSIDIAQNEKDDMKAQDIITTPQYITSLSDNRTVFLFAFTISTALLGFVFFIRPIITALVYRWSLFKTRYFWKYVASFSRSIN